MKFRTVADRWIERNRDNWTPGTLENVEGRLRIFYRYCKSLKVPIGDITRLTEDHIARWMKYRHKHGTKHVAPTTGTILSIIDFAVHEKYLERNPVDRKYLPKFPTPASVKVPFTYEQMKRIVRYIDNYMSHPRSRHAYCHIDLSYWSLACKIAWHTGMRMSDVMTLTWDRVNFDDEIIVCYPQKLRREGQRLEIPMEPELYKVLLKHRNKRTEEEKESPCVMPQGNHDYNYFRKKMNKAFGRFCVGALLPNHSFHSFRHGFITRLLNAGVEAIVVGSMTGQSVETVAIYAHISPQAKFHALERSRDAFVKARLQQAGLTDQAQAAAADLREEQTEVPFETLALPEPKPEPIVEQEPPKPTLTDTERDILLNLR